MRRRRRVRCRPSITRTIKSSRFFPTAIMTTTTTTTNMFPTMKATANPTIAPGGRPSRRRRGEKKRSDDTTRRPNSRGRLRKRWPSFNGRRGMPNGDPLRKRRLPHMHQHRRPGIILKKIILKPIIPRGKRELRARESRRRQRGGQRSAEPTMILAAMKGNAALQMKIQAMIFPTPPLLSPQRASRYTNYPKRSAAPSNSTARASSNAPYSQPCMHGPTMSCI
mmetsp:Transcript_26142/g.55145  ORF Transcript_26142/g.55145 Transcript_26142/m.55145 type:complete len:223 (+) Transcript_26142:339-1007(+)